ncbi:MAG TPA: stalk domain-containing protein [Bacillota bacterium]|nr:stalk domain-containing protein [Bacillota bacterium]
MKLLKNTPEIFVDGNRVIFDIDPFIQNGRTMVPLRKMAETLGCKVEWVEPDQINISRGDTFMKMYINKQTYEFNGFEKLLDFPPFVKGGGRTIVPLRFVAEELGCTVEYDEKTNSVYVVTK